MDASPAAHRRRALAQLVGAALLFATMALLTRRLAVRIPGPETAFVRFLLGVAATLVALGVRRLELRPRRWGWLAARGSFGGLAVLAYFSCIQHVPVGLATVLHYTSPVFTLLGSWVLLGERPRRPAVVGLVLTLVGVAVVMRARGLALHAGSWEMLGLLSALASGIALTAVRASRRPDAAGGAPPESTWSVFFSFTALGALVTLPAVTPPLGAWIRPTLDEWLGLAAVAAVSVAAQLLLTAALRHVSAVTFGIINQLTVVFTVAGGVVLFGEPLGAGVLAGSALTVAGVLWTVIAADAGKGASPLGAGRTD